MVVKYTSESDLRSYEATEEVAKKALKIILKLQRDSTSWAIPVRCSTNWAIEASLEAGQVRVQFNLYPLYEENDMVYMI